jgi:hypothetical protein
MTRTLERLDSKAGKAVRKAASRSVASLSRLVVVGRTPKMISARERTGHEAQRKGKQA